MQNKNANLDFHVYRPGAGLRTDLENLLGTFVKLESVRYEDFVKVWKEMKFYQIYCGRQNHRQLREFTEECLRLTVEYWMPPYNFQVRVGGLYALYGLYSTQIDPNKCQIRLTPAYWENIQEFLATIREQKHLDIEFIFRKLVQENAFLLVATTTELYPDRSVFSEIGEQDDSSQNEISILPELFQPDNISELSSIHEQYHQMKCLLAKSENPETSLDIMHPSVVQYITKQVGKHEEFRRTGGVASLRKKKGAETSDSESDYEPTVKESIGSKRTSLKDRAFSAAGGTIKSRRHRTVIKTTDEDEQSSSPKKKSKSSQRKRRTKFSTGSSESHDEMSSTEAVLEVEFTPTEDDEVIDMPVVSEDGPTDKGEKQPQNKNIKATEQNSMKSPPKRKGRKAAVKVKDSKKKHSKNKGSEVTT